MTRGQSLTLSTILLVALYIIVYAVHAAAGGAFALPPAVLAVLAPITPIVDYLAAWLIHGLSSGDWSPPPLPAPGQLPAGRRLKGVRHDHPSR